MKDKKRRGWIGIIVIILMAAAGSGFYMTTIRDAQAEEIVPVYKESTARLGEIQIDFEADGMASLQLTPLSFAAGGTLKKLNVDIGSTVNKNDVLAELDDTDLLAKIEDARSSYDLSLLQLSKTKEQYQDDLSAESYKLDDLAFQLGEIQREYAAMLAAPDAFSRLEIETRAAELANAKTELANETKTYRSLAEGSPDIQLDEFAVERSLKAIADAEADLADLKLYSPTDGIVARLSVQSGETVSGTQDFLTLASAAGPDIVAEVSELDVTVISVGQAVEIAFEAIEDRIFVGQVASIDPLASRDSSGLVNYTVHLSVDETDPAILDGMTCTVSFILREKKKILVIPNTAVRMVNGVQQVEIRDGNGLVIAKPVTTGLTDGLNVEVVSGLAAGDTILIRSK